MSWLHCFWGIGARPGKPLHYELGPLAARWAGSKGYRTVSVIQFALTAVLFLSLPMWKRQAPPEKAEEQRGRPAVTLPQAIRKSGACRC